MRHAVTWLAWVLLLWGVWVLLNLSALSAAEWGVGGVCAGLAAGVATALHAQGLLRMRPRLGWLRFTGRLLRHTVLDTGTVLAEVVRRLAGRPSRAAFRTYSFPARGRDARSVARKVLATTALSLPPNAFVIDFDEEGDRVLVHELVARPRPDDHWRHLL
ncbi:Na+/H+ antiporter subunit E [Melittangium boletus]|uniref:Uncharacterized protein n=1 Tax=Melittangium boletus DSM 14713 TaxID=1294270 RepID=A0A250IET5_9BACT|nr:Na+/H+ antiporter subunit E [Melittangium boletus]ATB29672.1 hypothetical protein MEBOL_003127 [Melittangium boletus DSM 14713]